MTRLIPVVGALVAAVLATGVAAATNVGFKPSPPSARLAAGAGVEPPPAPSLPPTTATTPTTPAPAPSTTAAPPPPSRVTVPRRVAVASRAPAQPAAGGDIPPPAFFAPRPRDCWATPQPDTWTPPGPGLFLVPADGSAPGPPVVPDALRPASTTFSPDGRTIAFESWLPTSDGSGRNTVLYLVGRDGTDIRRLVPAAFSPKHVAWSPDGRWLAFEDVDPTTKTSDLYLTDPRGETVRRLTSGGMADGTPRWAYQSDRIAFAGNWAFPGAWVVPVNGGEASRVFDQMATGVSWSPDGSRLVVGMAGGGSMVVGAVPGPQAVRLESEMGGIAEWSPTAEEIAARLVGTTLYGPDGSLLRNLGGIAGVLAWAPDGRSLAGAGQDGLYILNHQDCPRRVVTNGTLLTMFGAWAPDGTSFSLVVSGR